MFNQKRYEQLWNRAYEIKCFDSMKDCKEFYNLKEKRKKFLDQS